MPEIKVLLFNETVLPQENNPTGHLFKLLRQPVIMF